MKIILSILYYRLFVNICILNDKRKEMRKNDKGMFEGVIFLYYILLKIYFLKLCLNGLENLRQRKEKKRIKLK
jgi:hypothetical protein